MPPRALRFGRGQLWVIATDQFVQPAGSVDARRLGMPLVSVEVVQAGFTG